VIKSLKDQDAYDVAFAQKEVTLEDEEGESMLCPIQ
jgi:hypothetical protein